MKLLFLILTTVITMNTFSQINFGISGGISQSKPLMAFNIGYTLNSDATIRPEIQYDQRFYLSNLVDKPAYFGFRGGLVISNENDKSKLALLTGPSFKLSSTNKTNLNGWVYGFGLRYSYNILMFDTYYIDRHPHITFGLFLPLTK